MAVPQKERFIREGIKVNLMRYEGNFPPEKIDYDGETLTLLGLSNKNDLHPKDLNVEDIGLQKAVFNSQMGQYVYCSPNAVMFDVLLYVDDTECIILNSIRTRQLPK